MNVEQLNLLLSQENTKLEKILPKLRQYQKMEFQFTADFGLDELPREPGIILIRGARQFGKSTWLELELAKSYKLHGPGSSFYLNGDEIAIAGSLLNAIESLVERFRSSAKVKRIFIDEISAVSDWEKAIKLLADRGSLDDILLITTGSKATDIRRGAERLPGRKGKINKNNYIFTPISYKEFCRVVSSKFKNQTMIAYLLSGGSPLAVNELARLGYIPEYVITLTRDWLIGEVVRTGRQRSMLLRIFEFLHRYGGNTVSYTKLAKEAELANNTVAAGYIEQLQDLLCLVPTLQCEPKNLKRFYRKASKLHFSNILAAIATSNYNPRSIEDFLSLTPEEQGKYYEWLVAQELWRLNSINEKEYTGELSYYCNKDKEIDFIIGINEGLEVKRGQASPHEFQWLLEANPEIKIKVISTNKIDQRRVASISLEEFLLNGLGGKYSA